MKKPIFTYQEITPSESRAASVEFKASRGWLEKFMRRDNLTLRKKTSLSQKCPDKVILNSDLISFISCVTRLIISLSYITCLIMSLYSSCRISFMNLLSL